VDGDDVRVAEAGEGLGFAGEAVGKAWVGDALGREEFKGDEAVEGLLPGLVNDAHAAAANEFQDFELREGGGHRFQSRRRRAAGFGAGVSGQGDAG
jgi:hypothetical protein